MYVFQGISVYTARMHIVCVVLAPFFLTCCGSECSLQELHPGMLYIRQVGLIYLPSYSIAGSQ